MNLIKVHEDTRRSIHLVKDLLPDNKEFTFIRLHKGKAMGGCYHTKDENWVVIQGEVTVFIETGYELQQIVAKTGDSGVFPAGFPHSFVAQEESIVAEWGITTEEKEADIKDPTMREMLNKINDE